MSSYDTATWTCPICGERVESERVVDETFMPRLLAHKAEHESGTVGASPQHTPRGRSEG